MPLPCPGCGYDLSNLSQPVCPECARPFSRDELATRARRLFRLAINLLTFGSLAVILARAAGAIAGPSSPTSLSARALPGTSPNNASALLEYTPALLLAAGLALLGSLTAASARQRRWPAMFALLYALSTLFAFAALYNSSPSSNRFSLLQPAHWLPINQWLRTLSTCLLPAAAAAVLLRLTTHERALSRLIRPLRAAAILALLLTLAAELQAYIASHNRATPPPGTLAPPDPYWASWELTYSLHFLADLLNHTAWITLAIAGLITRAVCSEPPQQRA